MFVRWRQRLLAGSLPLQLRYYLSVLSISLIDFVFALIFDIPLYKFLPGALLLIGFALLLARIVVAPIVAFLEDPAAHRLPRRRVAWLAEISTAWMGALLVLQTIAKFWILPPLLGIDVQALMTPLEQWSLPIIHCLFFTAVIYFVMTDFTAILRLQIFRRTGVSVGPGRSRLVYQLLVGFGLTSVIPITLIVIHSVGQGSVMERQQTLLQDLAAAAFALLVTVFFISRSLLRPLGELEATMAKVGAEGLNVKAPVLSRDEVGRLAAVFNQMADGVQEQQFIRDTFGRYVPKRVANAILEGRGSIEPQTAVGTILYSDIENFTSIVERLNPERVVEMLNEYFTVVLEPIERNGGVVNQFQGDAMLVTFNLPIEDPLHADRAVQAAEELQAAISGRTFAGIQLSARIGIATGTVIAGNIGAEHRLNYTVHGDAVNVAARLEQLNKAIGSRILMSESTVQLLKGQFRTIKVGRTEVRGKQEALTIYRLDSADYPVRESP